MFSKLNKKEYAGHKKKVYILDWNSTGSKLASGSGDNTVRVKTCLWLDRYGTLIIQTLKLDLNSKV